MAQYRVLERSFIGNAIVEEGEIVEYDGEAAANLEPLVKKWKKVVAAPGANDAKDVAGEGLV